MYRGTILKSRDGIPRPTPPPPGRNMAREARIARSRFYPVTIAYTTYAFIVLAGGLRLDPATTIVSAVGGAVSFTLVEYLVHRYVLHGRFPDGPGGLRHALHVLFDASHGDHHLRPWDGHHINGGLSTAPFAIILVLAASIAPLPTLPVFLGTILLAYVVEEWIHYAVHFHRLPSRYFAYIRRHHLYHHSGRGGEVAFGLSSGVWDVPLGTPIPPRDREVLHARARRAPVPRIVAMLAIAVTCGSVHAEAQGPRRALAFGVG
jgi:sterol desaturase/sphingolipid hydroxylase (fatty acid hydroxylase superfamily)